MGLGIRRTEDANVSFLAKQGWKVLTRPGNIWVKLVRAKYLNNSSSTFFKVTKSPSALNAWENNLGKKKLLQKGVNFDSGK